MLHLRNIRSQKIIFRGVNAVPRPHAAVTFSTSDLASKFPENEENARKSKTFEPVKEERTLAFRLPDLSEREETFLKQQIRIILRPDCLQNETTPGKDILPSKCAILC